MHQNMRASEADWKVSFSERHVGKIANDQKDPKLNPEFYLRFRCPQCGILIEHYQEWLSHIDKAHKETSTDLQLHHIIKKNNFYCTLCKEMLYTNEKSKLQRHLFQHLPYKEYFQCAYCSVQKVYKTEVLRHLIHVHKREFESAKPYIRIPNEWGSKPNEGLVTEIQDLLKGRNPLQPKQELNLIKKAPQESNINLEPEVMATIIEKPQKALKDFATSSTHVDLQTIAGKQDKQALEELDLIKKAPQESNINLEPEVMGTKIKRPQTSRNIVVTSSTPVNPQRIAGEQALDEFCSEVLKEDKKIEKKTENSLSNEAARSYRVAAALILQKIINQGKAFSSSIHMEQNASPTRRSYQRRAIDSPSKAKKIRIGDKTIAGKQDKQVLEELDLIKNVLNESSIDFEAKLKGNIIKKSQTSRNTVVTSSTHVDLQTIAGKQDKQALEELDLIKNVLKESSIDFEAKLKGTIIKKPQTSRNIVVTSSTPPLANEKLQSSLSNRPQLQLPNQRQTGVQQQQQQEQSQLPTQRQWASISSQQQQLPPQSQSFAHQTSSIKPQAPPRQSQMNFESLFSRPPSLVLENQQGSTASQYQDFLRFTYNDPRLEVHMRLICPECGKEYISFKLWRIHLNEVHNYKSKTPEDFGFQQINDYFHQCQVCHTWVRSTDSSIAVLQSHRFLHLPFSCTYGCRYCTIAFDRKSALREHLFNKHARHVSINDNGEAASTIACLEDPKLNPEFYLRFRCPQCGILIEHYQEWLSHIDKAHKETSTDLRLHRINTNKFYCTLCKKMLYTNEKSKLQRHLFQHLPYKEYFQCAYCSVQKVYKTEVLRHFIHMHKREFESAKPYIRIPDEWGSKPNEALVRELQDLLKGRNPLQPKRELNLIKKAPQESNINLEPEVMGTIIKKPQTSRNIVATSSTPVNPTRIAGKQALDEFCSKVLKEDKKIEKKSENSLSNEAARSNSVTAALKLQKIINQGKAFNSSIHMEQNASPTRRSYQRRAIDSTSKAKKIRIGDKEDEGKRI